MKGVTCSDEPSENEQLNLQLYRRQLIVLLSSPQRKASFSGGSCFSSNKTYKIWLYITCSAPQTPKANAGLTNRLNIGLSFVLPKIYGQIALCQFRQCKALRKYCEKCLVIAGMVNIQDYANQSTWLWLQKTEPWLKPQCATAPQSGYWSLLAWFELKFICTEIQ